MYDFALSALATAHRADLLREGCLSRLAAKAQSTPSLASRIAAHLPGRATPVEPCGAC